MHTIAHVPAVQCTTLSANAAEMSNLTVQSYYPRINQLIRFEVHTLRSHLGGKSIFAITGGAYVLIHFYIKQK